MGATKKTGNAAKKSDWNKKKIMAVLIQRRLQGDSLDTLKNWLIDEHNLSLRNVKYYLSELTDNIASDYVKTSGDKKANAMNPTDVNEMIARLDAIYKDANSFTRLAILKEISELKGLKNKKVDLNLGGEPIKITIIKTDDDDKKES